MNAMRLKVDWTESENGQPFPILSGSGAVRSTVSFVRLGAEPKAQVCPHCGSIIYSRRHPHCGACEAPLPESCRFSEREAGQVMALFQWEREQHKNWRKRIA